MKANRQKGFMNIKRLFIFAKENYFIAVITLCVLFVGFVSAYKLFFSKPTYVYVKVKMGQGLWWATTQKPSAWFVEAIKQSHEENDLTGKPIVEVQNVVYYPWYGSGQYDTYITTKLKVSKLGSTGKYNFKRSTIGVGAPIDFEFNNAQFSGTIIKLSEAPIQEKYVEKTVILTKKGAYPWEADAIQVGDSYHNGNKEVLRIIDKKTTDTASITGDTYGNYLPSNQEGKLYIVATVKLKGKMEGNQFIYGEEQLVIPGKGLSIGTQRFVFSDFMVAKVE